MASPPKRRNDVVGSSVGVRDRDEDLPVATWKERENAAASLSDWLADRLPGSNAVRT